MTETKGADGEAFTTVDRRDPRFAPHKLDPAHQKLADAMNAASGVTYDHAVRHVLRAMAHARHLTEHSDKPIRVLPVGRDGSPHTASMASMIHMASMGRHVAAASYNRSVSSSSETRIGQINVHTAATDARGIVADIEPHLHRGQAAGRGDYGLA